MLIFPAIDLLSGRCVRLRQGRFDEATIYSDDPVAVARSFVERGARALHVVDLEGAREGRPRNIEWVQRIREAVAVTLQVGGGIRSLELADRLLEGGVDRIVLGTAAIEDPALLGKLLGRHPVERVAASVDLREGRLAVRGWEQDSQRPVNEVLGEMREIGLRHLVCTDVNRDGILVGPSLELARRMVGEGFEVIMAGGIATREDIVRVRRSGAVGCVIGSALYSGMLSLPEALDAADAD